MLDKTVNTPEYLDVDKQINVLTDKCIDFEITDKKCIKFCEINRELSYLKEEDK